jgi:hypothetical protein
LDEIVDDFPDVFEGERVRRIECEEGEQEEFEFNEPMEVSGNSLLTCL